MVCTRIAWGWQNGLHWNSWVFAWYSDDCLIWAGLGTSVVSSPNAHPHSGSLPLSHTPSRESGGRKQLRGSSILQTKPEQNKNEESLQAHSDLEVRLTKGDSLSPSPFLLAGGLGCCVCTRLQ